jgi:protein tyrosine phosphatase (PTP) superfamily phosphohydrolase (DUF442 family)
MANKRRWIILAVTAAVLAGVTIYFYPVISAYVRAAPERRSPQTSTTRPADWAQPMQVKGLHNVHRVSDDLIRGAQPTAEGLAALKAMGVKTVVNLQVFHDDHAEQAGLQNVRIDMQSWRPKREQVVEFLRVMNDPNRRPVYVHCYHGSDRTGTMVALYRIAIQGWTKEQAIDEMTRGGFGYHPIWQNLLEFIDSLDIEAIRRDAGISR